MVGLQLLHENMNNTKNSENHTSSVDDTIRTILPSYSMFTSTIGMNVNVPEDNYQRYTDAEPPSYNQEDLNTVESSSVSVSQASSALHNMSLGSSRTSTNDSLQVIDENGSFIVADENTWHWRETILDNVHRLPNLTFQSHKISEAVKLEVHFTKDVCELGKKPELIDPYIYEYKQGDLLNGYILIKNTSEKPIPFEMFYLLFEGNFMVANPLDAKDKVPVKIRKFLEMFDFSGSWNEGNISRLATEEMNPHACLNIIDPIDGSALCFKKEKIIFPGITYKRFFTFRIPNNLLDSECNDHALSKHVELPPTMGLSRWETAHFPERAINKIKDFTLLNTSVSYGVMARFIGRKSTWEVDFGKIDTPSNSTRIVNSQGDEYIILKELTNYFRVVKKTPIPTDNERLMKLLENKLMYNNFILRIKEKIDAGKRLIESIESSNFTGSIDIGKELTQTELELAKCKQFYKPDSIRDTKLNPNRIEHYETFLPLVRKSLTGNKPLGTLRVSTPKKEFCVSYIPPLRFRQQSIENLVSSWKFEIPVDMSIAYSSLNTKPSQLPNIVDVKAELAVLTIRSDSKPIPIEFNHDLIFNKQCNGQFIDSDNFNENIIKPFRKYSTDLYKIYKKLGSENFKIEQSLVDDLKSICKLEHKTFNLRVKDIMIDGKPGKPSSKGVTQWSIDENGAKSSFTVGINLENLELKGDTNSNKSKKSYDNFTLVPDFQSCFMCRLYHVKLTMALSNDRYVNIKVPVRVQKVV